MSVQTEITRITNARNTLRSKAQLLGLDDGTGDITTLASEYNAIVDRGTPAAQVQEGETYSIQQGYYHGGTVSGIAGGGNYTLQSKTVTPTKSQQVVNEDSGYYGLDNVTVEAIPSIYQDVSSVTAEASDVLATKVIVESDGSVTAGTMTNNGTVSQSLDCGESYTIPEGFHSGSGTVTANSLSSQTSGTATAADILSNKTAWVNGSQITGNISTITLPTSYPGSIISGYTEVAAIPVSSSVRRLNIAKGYNSANSYYTLLKVATSGISAVNIKTGVTVSVGDSGSASRITSVTGTFTASNTLSTGKTAATASDILQGRGAFIDGEEVDGTIVNRGTITGTITGLGAVSGDTSFTVPEGYTTGGTVSLTSDIEDALALI